MASKALVYIGIALGVAGMGAAIAYGTVNQDNYLPEGAELAPAAEQGSFSSPSGLISMATSHCYRNRIRSNSLLIDFPVIKTR